jgi:metabolite-proton symporter
MPARKGTMSNISPASDPIVVEGQREPSPPVMKKVAFASFVGTSIEFYDFFIYATAAALVFPTVFFPQMTPALATAASFSTFAVAFISRPFGAALFGHLGDRLGRKKTLVATLLIMGISTILVGLLPDANTIGVAAPIILLFLRLMQGVAVGGEWAGAALLAAEYAPAGKRGLYGMFTQLGAGAGLALTNVVFLIVNVSGGEKNDAFLTWGWRLPFLFSAVLVIIALYVRLNIEETPVFREQKKKSGPVKAPIAELFRHQTGQVLLGAGCMLASYIFIFVGGTYLLGHANTVLHHPRSLILTAGIVAGVSLMAFSALSAILSDKHGRRPVMITGLILSLPWTFIVMPMVNTGEPILFILGVFGTLALMGIFYGPMASFLPEIYATRYRYSGASLAYNISGLVGGAIPPMLIAPLVLTNGVGVVGVMMAILVVASIFSTLALPETRAAALEEVG